MAYASIDDIRTLTGLTASEITDLQISGILVHAVAEINADIQIRWEDESVRLISNEKQNKRDGINTIFYTIHFPIGDRDNNAVISGADVQFYVLDSLGVRTEIVVSEILNSMIGKYEVVTAPKTTDRAYTTYHSSPVDMATPHALVKLAVSQLAAALCYTRIDVGKVQSFSVGKVRVTKQSQAFDIYYKMYWNTINRIRSKIFKKEVGDKTL